MKPKATKQMSPEPSNQSNEDRKTKETRPNTPSLKCSSEKNNFHADEQIPLSIRVHSPSHYSKTDFVVNGTIEKTRDENGAFIDQQDRGDDLTWDIEPINCTVEPGDEVTVIEGMLQPEDPGVYVLKAEIREQKDKDDETNQMHIDQLRTTMPVLSTSMTTFNVGGVPTHC